MLQTIFAKLPYFLLFFARGGALFIFSPLFMNKGIPLPIRILLAILSALLLFPITSLPIENLWLLVIKEFAIGYLLGTLFAFILEAALLAGSWFATIAGFSATELLYPLQKNTPLFSLFFTLLVIALILALDLHHLFLFESFTLLPIESTTPSPHSLLTLAQSAQFIFNHAQQFILLPLFAFFIIMIFMAFLSKCNPEIPIFWLGFPIQIFIGLLSLSFFLVFILPLVEKGFMELLSIAKRFLFSL